MLKGNTALLATVESGFSIISPAESAAINRKWLGAATVNTLPLRYFGMGFGVILFLASTLLLWNRSLQRRVQQRTDELNAVFTSMQDIVIVYDRNGRYLNIPTGSSTYLYRPQEIMTGKLVSEILPPQQARYMIENIDAALQKRAPVSHRIFAAHPKRRNLVLGCDLAHR